MRKVSPLLSYRNNRFHNWVAQIKVRGDKLPKSKLIQIAKDNLGQWKYNLKKLTKNGG